MMGSTGIALVLLFCVGFFTPPADVCAKTKVMPIEGVAYNIQSSLAENLKAFVGKRVSVTLESGNTLTGLVKAVGDHLMHLEKLAGKDYFDALIRLDRITAIDTRFREVQR
jgi:hypothetical protein